MTRIQLTSNFVEVAGLFHLWKGGTLRALSKAVGLDESWLARRCQRTAGGYYMTKLVLLDEIHIEVRVPRTLAKRQLAAIRRVLQSRALLPRLRRAIVIALNSHPCLAASRIRVTR
jgi:hypothetical protein